MVGNDVFSSYTDPTSPHLSNAFGSTSTALSAVIQLQTVFIAGYPKCVNSSSQMCYFLYKILKNQRIYIHQKNTKLYDELIEKSLTVNTFFSFRLPFFISSSKGTRERYFSKHLCQPGIYFFTESKNIQNSSQTELQRAENHLQISISLKFHQLDLKIHSKHKAL